MSIPNDEQATEAAAEIKPLTFVSAKRYFGSDLTGKTIANVEFWCSELLLSFTDGTYTRLVATPDTEESAALESEPATVELEGYYPNYVEFGIFTQAEYDAEIARLQGAELRRSRAEFERLKKMFGEEASK